jgi:hypothetical protein
VTTIAVTASSGRGVANKEVSRISGQEIARNWSASLTMVDNLVVAIGLLVAVKLRLNVVVSVDL